MSERYYVYYTDDDGIEYEYSSDDINVIKQIQDKIKSKVVMREQTFFERLMSCFI